MAIVAVLIDRIGLLVSAGEGSPLPGDLVALGPLPGQASLVGDVSPAAEAFGVLPGMRVSEAFARCPGLRLIAPDPEAARALWADVLDRLEAIGAATESDRPGTAFFDAGGLVGLHRGLGRVLDAARRGIPRRARFGVAPTRFAAYAASRQGRSRTPRIVRPELVREFLAPLSVRLLGARSGLEHLPPALERLGIATLGALAGVPAAALGERFGHAGVFAHELACGRDTPLQPRRPPEPVVEQLDLPEAVAGGQLERAVEILATRVLSRPDRRGRTLRVLALSGRLAGGGTWYRRVTMRTATADLQRILLVVGPRIHEIGAPVESLALAAEEFGPPAVRQDTFTRDPVDLRRARIAEAVTQARQVAGGDAVMRVLEVAPESRLPERRSVLTPFPINPRS